ncbi:hypothetical protein C8J57DRAFT_1235420 [Mycena rebaudengoi]|nr:hypothetical protein C8J57DRAFT_1235420 [Mycena rebaudengoi]
MLQALKASTTCSSNGYSTLPLIKVTPQLFNASSAMPQPGNDAAATVVLGFHLNKGCLFSKFVDAHGIAIPHTQLHERNAYLAATQFVLIPLEAALEKGLRVFATPPHPTPPRFLAKLDYPEHSVPKFSILE